MKQVILGRDLGKAVAEVLGIDWQRVPVLEADISARPNETAYINLKILLEPGRLSQIEEAMACLPKPVPR